jgi:hypothetical protein
MVSRIVATGQRALHNRGVPEAQQQLRCEAIHTLPRVVAVSLTRGEKPFKPPTVDIEDTIRLLQSTHSE